MQLKTNLKVCLMAAFAGIFMFSCSKEDKQGANGGQKDADEAPLVKVEEVHEEDVTQSGTYTASVDADIINNISSSIPGRITKLTVDVGMEVSKGEVLVVLEDVNLENYKTQVESAKTQLASAKTSVDNAQGSLNSAQASYDLADLNLKRAQELLKIGGGTQQNVDAMNAQFITASNNLATAKSGLTSAKSGLATAQSSLETAERNLRNAQENTVLTSPVDGVITRRNFREGDMASGTILTVAKVDPVKVVSNISESEFSKIKKGMEIACTFDTYGDELFTGIVTLISPTIDTSTRTFGIEVTVPNPDSRILPGMYGKVKVDYGTERHVVVPDKAVVKQPGSGNHFVYIYKDGKVTYNKVELGERFDDSYEILSGVEDGDQVVVSGQSRLADGVEVRLQK